MRAFLRTLTLLAGMCVCCLAALAQVTPLPDFHLSSMDGSPISSHDLGTNGHWIILYVHTNCRPCNTALAQLKLLSDTSQSSANGTPVDLSKSLVVIVQEDKADVINDMISQYPWLKSGHWYVDDSHEAYSALHLTGSPTLLALQGSSIVWKLSGITSNPGRVNEMVMQWMRSTPPARAATKHPVQGSAQF